MRCGLQHALEPRVSSPAARAEVHRRDETEARREERAAADAGDRDDAVLERLAQAPRARAAGTRRARRGAERRGARGSTSPGRGTAPPPTTAAADAPWCGARNGGAATSADAGGRVPAIEWIRVTSSASARLSGRQDPGQPAREHRLARARWAGEQQVVPAGCCELQSPTPPLLPADVREIGQRCRRSEIVTGRHRIDRIVPEQVCDGLGQMANPDRLHAREGRLAPPTAPGTARARTRPAPRPRRRRSRPATGRTEPSRPSSPMHACSARLAAGT